MRNEETYQFTHASCVLHGNHEQRTQPQPKGRPQYERLASRFTKREDMPVAVMLVLPILCDEKGRRPDLESMRRGMEAFNSASRRVAKETGVRFLDLKKKIPKSRKYFYDDVHYTYEGNRLVVDVFYADFIAGGMLETTGREDSDPAQRVTAHHQVTHAPQPEQTSCSSSDPL